MAKLANLWLFNASVIAHVTSCVWSKNFYDVATCFALNTPKYEMWLDKTPMVGYLTLFAANLHHLLFVSCFLNVILRVGSHLIPHFKLPVKFDGLTQENRCQFSRELATSIRASSSSVDCHLTNPNSQLSKFCIHKISN